MLQTHDIENTHRHKMKINMYWQLVTLIFGTIIIEIAPNCQITVRTYRQLIVMYGFTEVIWSKQIHIIYFKF